ncbi:MAG: methylated-DNA--[protein]-cysteine S-methyltransferase [Polyangiaceae bacterium]
MVVEESLKKILVGRTIPSPLGKIWLVATGDALLVAEFFGQKYERPFELPEHTKKHRVLDLAEREFELYFAGKLTVVRTPLAGMGTPFQKKVWRGLCKIPFGETRSYLELAKSVAIDPAAVRAVGMANARNPIAIFVPCHRVIAASGALSGYAGGVDKKKWLLAHEAKQLPLLA